MSVPRFQTFDPTQIEWQILANNAFFSFDYEKGILEQFFSGAVGSAKTIEHIHQLTRHCLENAGARVLMVRRALKDLKRTSWKVLTAHISDIKHVIKSVNKTDMVITFINGSEIIGDSYDKGDLEKFRSLDLSGLDIEEATEMDEKETYEALKLRVGRIPSVKQNFIQVRTNPDSPTHWLYDYFIDKPHENCQLFYSITEQNPFLPKWYADNIRRDYSPRMVRRMLYGEWLEISTEVIYENYSSQNNFKKDTEYKINPNYPLCQFHDFNIGKGKPMSAGIGQLIDGVAHIFKIFMVDGARTPDIMDDIIESGIYKEGQVIHLYGDASGDNNNTRSIMSDYDLIVQRLEKEKMKVVYKVPRTNPPLKRRHNLMNGLFKNDLSQVRFYLYKGCDRLDKGFRLTKPLKGSSILEDDSLPEQHLTTAVGYWLDFELEIGEKKKSTQINL